MLSKHNEVLLKNHNPIIRLLPSRWDSRASGSKWQQDPSEIENTSITGIHSPRRLCFCTWRAGAGLTDKHAVLMFCRAASDDHLRTWAVRLLQSAKSSNTHTTQQLRPTNSYEPLLVHDLTGREFMSLWFTAFVCVWHDITARTSWSDQRIGVIAVLFDHVTYLSTFLLGLRRRTIFVIWWESVYIACSRIFSTSRDTHFKMRRKCLKIYINKWITTTGNR